MAITAGWDRERTARDAIKQRFPAFHPPRAPDAVDTMAADFANIGTPPGLRRGAAGPSDAGANTVEGERRRAVE